eukprot:453706-Amphidinium_carterae.2
MAQVLERVSHSLGVLQGAIPGTITTNVPDYNFITFGNELSIAIANRQHAKGGIRKRGESKFAHKRAISCSFALFFFELYTRISIKKTVALHPRLLYPRLRAAKKSSESVDVTTATYVDSYNRRGKKADSYNRLLMPCKRTPLICSRPSMLALQTVIA